MGWHRFPHPGWQVPAAAARVALARGDWAGLWGSAEDLLVTLAGSLLPGEDASLLGCTPSLSQTQLWKQVLGASRASQRDCPAEFP